MSQRAEPQPETTSAPKRDTARAAAAEALFGGAVAGVVAGLGMGLFAMVGSAFAGLGVWFPIKLVAAAYRGEMALIGDAGLVLLGFATHLAVAAVFGFVFAVMAGSRIRPLTAILSGLAYGAGVFLVMTYLVLPAVDRVMLERVTPQLRWFFAAHLVYGLVLGLAPWLGRRWHARRHERAAPP